EESSENLSGSVQLGFFKVGYREKVKGYPLVLQFVIKQDYLNDKLSFQIQVCTAGYLEEEVHRPIEIVLEKMQNFEWENSTVHWIRSKWLLVHEIDSIANFDASVLAEKFLHEFSQRCAVAHADFKGLRFVEPAIEKQRLTGSELLDNITVSFSSVFSNQIYKERNMMKGCRYIDYVYSNKKVTHWLGWGLEYNESQLNAIVLFSVSDTIKGAHLVDIADLFIKENPDWKQSIPDDQSTVEPLWIFNSLPEQNLKCSSEWNRNYSAKYAQIDNEKRYWCPKHNDDKQWIQIQLPALKEIKRLKIQGAPHGKNFIQKFNLAYSIDGKTWQKIDQIEALSSGDETKEIVFDQTIRALYLKIEPTEFVGYPGLRMDVQVMDVMPSKMELITRMPIINDESFEDFTRFIEDNVKSFQNYFKAHIGF
ncbi:MAG: discoidin domain-containing protein, partial [Bacteroidota bacterium]